MSVSLIAECQSIKHLSEATNSTDAMTHNRTCHASLDSVAHWFNSKAQVTSSVVEINYFNYHILEHRRK